MSGRMCLNFRPFDTLVFRDSKELTPGGQANTVFPLPSTFYGALRAHHLCSHEIAFDDYGKLSDGDATVHLIGKRGSEEAANGFRMLGPFHWDGDRVWYPLPANYFAGGPAGDSGWPVENDDTPLWDIDAALRPIAAPSESETMEKNAWFSETALKHFLIGRVHSTRESPDPRIDFQSPAAFGESERRFGHERNRDSLVVKEHMLFSVSHWRYTEDVNGGPVGFSVVVDGATKKDFPEGDLFLGGKRRLARVTHGTPASFADVNAIIETKLSETHRFFLYLATPALFRNGWRPEPIKDVEADLVAAAVGKPRFAGGFDSAGRVPRPGRNAAPAGSVYFYEFKSDAKVDVGKLVERFQFNESISDYRKNTGFGITALGLW